MSNLYWLCQGGQATTLLGGQWGSEAKGCAAAWLAVYLQTIERNFSLVTTNAGAQAGHSSTHNGVKRIVYHLPTYPLIQAAMGLPPATIYLNAGSIIDPDIMQREINTHRIDEDNFFIHPNAAVITDEDKEAEMHGLSPQTKIASTRKGVGQALANKVLRASQVARHHPTLKSYVRRIDLNARLGMGHSVLVEIPQGFGLSLNHSRFYPHVTSRDCTPMNALADAGIHHTFGGKVIMVLRTFPIRVGNIHHDGHEIGFSGHHYPDQMETSWETLGVEAEITTVTKRIRRVFTWSMQQVSDAIGVCRPDLIFLTFCNYLKTADQVQRIQRDIFTACKSHLVPIPVIVYQWGPDTNQVGFSLTEGIKELSWTT